MIEVDKPKCPQCNQVLNQWACADAAAKASIYHCLAIVECSLCKTRIEIQENHYYVVKGIYIPYGGIKAKKRNK